jgi:hypothetical protein
MIRRIAVVAAALLAAACSSINVQTQYDPGADFTRYRTYAWLDQAPGAQENPAMRNPLVLSMIIHAIDARLPAEGFTKVPIESSPAMLVTVHGYAQDRIEVTQYGYTYSYGPYGFYPAGAPVPVTDVSQYREGTLLLDFVDAQTKQLVWRGVATAVIQRGGVDQGQVDEAVAHLLAAYPPPKK